MKTTKLINAIIIAALVTTTFVMLYIGNTSAEADKGVINFLALAIYALAMVLAATMYMTKTLPDNITRKISNILNED